MEQVEGEGFTHFTGSISSIIGPQEQRILLGYNKAILTILHILGPGNYS